MYKKVLYPQFITDQQNILDIVISEKETDILKLILYPSLTFLKIAVILISSISILGHLIN